MILRIVFTLALLLVISTPAHAHERSRSHSSWTLEGSQLSGRFVVDARLSTLLLSVAPSGSSLNDALAQRLVAGLDITLGGRACQLNDTPRLRALPGGQISAGLDWTCDAANGQLIIDVEVFAPLAANHVHFIRLRKPGGLDDERVLSRNRTRAIFETSATAIPGPFSALGSYFRLGIEHILSGADHLVFLAGLLLLVRRRFRDAITVTLGFTVGHSITLVMTAIGYVAPPTLAIEAMIGFSIVFVAGEAVFAGHHRLRMIGAVAAVGLLLAGLVSTIAGGQFPFLAWLGLSLFVGCYALWLSGSGKPGELVPGISLLFGLVHGIGFGGVLVASHITPSRLVPSLLGFNLGVEAGQLLALGLAGVLVWTIHRYVPANGLHHLRLATALVASLLGMFWFVGRALGQV
jgi:hypothetical protein